MLISDKEIALKVAWHFLGLPYRWGGDDPMGGFDCSGYILEILKSVGIVNRNIDMTADQIYRHFKEIGCLSRVANTGMLIFWKDLNAPKIRHVEFCISSSHTIGASGGGSNVINELEASRRNAFIKVRPINTHDDSIHGFADPFKNVL